LIVQAVSGYCLSSAAPDATPKIIIWASVLGSLMDTSTPRITEIDKFFITSFAYSRLSRKVLTGVVCVSAQARGFLKDLYNSQSPQGDIFVV